VSIAEEDVGQSQKSKTKGQSKYKPFLGFVVPCIFKYSNKTPNQMQQPVVKFIA
jgi:hypothetical protein